MAKATNSDGLKGRLQGVRRRKRPRTGFASDVLQQKIKLVRIQKRKGQ